MIKPEKIILTSKKNISLKIDRKGDLIVRAPKNIDINRVFAFINEKEKWIIEKQNLVKNTLNLNSDLINLEEILFLGKKYEVIFIKNQNEIILTENALCVPSKYGFSTNKLISNIKQWYISNAEVLLINRTQELLKFLKTDCKSISIINSKAKWGMCDNKKNLYLNFKLLFLSHNLIDYVIFHEITHLTELNHSENFYNELKRIMPNYKTYSNQLKKCGFLLNIL